MDAKHPVYDTGILGLLALVYFWLTCVMMNDNFAMWILMKLEEPFYNEGKGASEAIARWVAAGVVMLFFGGIIQVLSMLIFGWTHLGGPGREVLAKQIKDRAGVSCFSGDLGTSIARSPSDALFAWVHYSDPRGALITWGRWKLRYAYLAENWIVAILSGIIAGVIAGLCSYNANAPWQDTPGLNQINDYLYAFIVLIGPFFTTLLIGLLGKFRRDNLDADLGMIAAYCAGVLCPDFRHEFMPPLQEKPSVRKCPKCEVTRYFK